MMSIHQDIRLLKIVIGSFALCSTTGFVTGITVYSRQDPFPLYSTLDPHEFVYRRYREELLQHPYELVTCDRWHIGISAFGQNANEGKNLCGQRVELGDLNGRWFVPGLLYGPVPAGQ